MYKCLDCGAEFEEPRKYRDSVPYGIGSVEMPERSCCPHCSGDYEEASECENCAKLFIPERAAKLCEDCIDNLKVRFSNILHKNFTETEIEVLNIIFDGRNLK